MVRIVTMDHRFENLVKNVEYLSTVLLTRVYFDLYYIYMLCTNIRGNQVPEGYTPFPFRRDTQESLLDKLRSVVATCRFRATIEYWKQRGADFSMHLYVPEVHPVTEEERHDRGDHNHLFRRMAKSVREGKDPKLDFEAFNDALHDPESGLTYAALIGKRKQSLKDAERLLSKHVADSLRRKGHDQEARHVLLIANWHEASDGRGLSQLKRSQYKLCPR